MPAYAMCRREDCPKAMKCYRFMGEVDDVGQPYADFPALCNEENDYQMFMRILKTDKLREIIITPKIESKKQTIE